MSTRPSQTPPHFPFEEPPFSLSMGLLKVPDSKWFEIDDLKERALQLAEKKKFLASIHDDVFMADPSALKASIDTLNLMIANLITYQPDLYSHKDDAIKLKPHEGFEGEEFITNLKKNTIHPLDLAAKLVQEDLIVMLPPNENQKGWWLAAGSLAFPSRWSLKKKFRKTMDDIHTPVPLYENQLKTPTNNFFNQIPCNQIFARCNWSLHDTPSLRQDGTKSIAVKTSINSKNAGEHLWLRVERQTIRKLKGTGAVLFTIRIHIHPLKEIVRIEGVAKRLNKAISILPTETQEYKQIKTFANSVKEYLEQY